MRKQDLYKIRQKERGLKLIEIWVPEANEQDIKDRAARLRKAHLKRLENAKNG